MEITNHVITPQRIIADGMNNVKITLLESSLICHEVKYGRLTLVCIPHQSYQPLKPPVQYVQPEPVYNAPEPVIYYKTSPAPTYEPVVEEYRPAPSYEPEEPDHYRDESSEQGIFPDIFPVRTVSRN